MKKHLIFLVTVLLSLFITSCRYDFILPVPAEPVPEGVSFATQVEPIFNTADKCTSCHKTGGQSPSFLTGQAYASIVPNLVDLAKPDQSIIYVYPGPTSSTHTWKKLTTNEAAVILQWIKEGAKNN
jgi:hypothetical protein